MLTGEQKAIQNMALDFAMAEMAPHAMKWDEEKIFPTDVLRELAQLGFAGVYVGEEYGGSGLSRLEAALVFEALSAG
ncbi:MAG: acyl-CoA dehydrogenase family protein, partial [Pseudomonadota bacterium]|nr:acyl-CoA dehydrogenase family protein [Pseudomonadota bacterium]